MAVTVSFAQKPGLYSPVATPFWYKLSCLDYNLPNFRYLVELTSYNSPSNFTASEFIGRSKINPDKDGYGWFSPHKLLKSTISPGLVVDVDRMYSYSFNLCGYKVKIGLGYNPKLNVGNKALTGMTTT